MNTARPTENTVFNQTGSLKCTLCLENGLYVQYTLNLNENVFISSAAGSQATGACIDCPKCLCLTVLA